MKLSEMKNIGKTLEDMLQQVDIKDSDDLKAIGSVEATMRLQLTDQACFNKLYALEGTIQDIRWHGLSKSHRQFIKDQYIKRTSRG